MKRNQVNSILINQTKRRNTVLVYICLIIIVLFFICSSFLMYANSNKAKYVNYDEESDIKYNVYYKDNEFFESEYLESNKQYIASLIDNIKVNFNYKISLDDINVEYRYTYRIEANVIVRDKNNKNLFYDDVDVLVKEQENVTLLNEVIIGNELIIDYNLYNDKIEKLISFYKLENAESFLNVNMYVNVVGSCDEFENDSETEKVITLSIPLAEDTIAIDFIENIDESSNNVIICDSELYNTLIFVVVGFVLTIFELILIFLMVRYEIKTRTAETIYEKELKKILNNYGSSIQILKSEFNFMDSQLLKIDSFSDMLEISDKLSQPILMKENKEKNGAYFLIPSNTNLLYVFRIKVSDIEKKIKRKK